MPEKLDIVEQLRKKIQEASSISDEEKEGLISLLGDLGIQNASLRLEAEAIDRDNKVLKEFFENDSDD